jgi:hypothetical protein
VRATSSASERTRILWKEKTALAFCVTAGVAVSVEDEYRKHAERCRVMAENSPKTADRAFWLLLAENWQFLAQEMETRVAGPEASLAPSDDPQCLSN